MVNSRKLLHHLQRETSSFNQLEMVWRKQGWHFGNRLLITLLAPLIQQLPKQKKETPLRYYHWAITIHVDVLRCYEADTAAFEQEGSWPITLVISISHITWPFDLLGSAWGGGGMMCQWGLIHVDNTGDDMSGSTPSAYALHIDRYSHLRVHYYIHYPLLWQLKVI